MNSDKISRKQALGSLIALPAFAAMLAAGTSIAEAKGSKAAFKYQSKPSGSHKCSNCTLFVPGKTAAANGTCKAVDGVISPNGWCIAYSPKK